MACEKCSNVAIDGPTQDQQYVDPFEAEPAPRTYKCPHCRQNWWCTAAPHIGFWTPLADDATLQAVLSGQPVMVGNPTIRV